MLLTLLRVSSKIPVVLLCVRVCVCVCVCVFGCVWGEGGGLDCSVDLNTAFLLSFSSSFFFLGGGGGGA